MPVDLPSDTYEGPTFLGTLIEEEARLIHKFFETDAGFYRGTEDMNQRTIYETIWFGPFDDLIDAVRGIGF